MTGSIQSNPWRFPAFIEACLNNCLALLIWHCFNVVLVKNLLLQRICHLIRLVNSVDMSWSLLWNCGSCRRRGFRASTSTCHGVGALLLFNLTLQLIDSRLIFAFLRYFLRNDLSLAVILSEGLRFDVGWRRAARNYLLQFTASCRLLFALRFKIDLVHPRLRVRGWEQLSLVLKPTQIHDAQGGLLCIGKPWDILILLCVVQGIN